MDLQKKNRKQFEIDSKNSKQQYRLSPALAQEINKLPRFPRNKRIKYASIPPADFDCVTEFLKRHINEPFAGISAAAHHIGIAANTLSNWRQKIKTSSDFDLKTEYQHKHMVMSPFLEEQILNEIETNFLQPGYYFNNHILKKIAIAAFNSAPEKDKFRTIFKASDSWCKSFRVRHGYVWRRAHYKKRPYHTEKSERYKQQFRETIETIYCELEQKDQLYLLANVDETSWKLAYVGELTWAKKGSKEVKINTEFDPKASFTTIGTITADKTKHPLCLIATGKSDRCHNQFGNFEQSFPGSRIFHSQSGWMNSDIMHDYLLWLRNLYDETYKDREGYQPGMMIHLILDCHTSHKKEETKEFARSCNIKLHYVPAGYTDEMQPLDIKVFGALKAKARSVFFNLINEHKELRSNKAIAAHVLGTCWDQLSSELLESAWKIYEFALYQEEVQNSIVEPFDESYSPEYFHSIINENIEKTRQQGNEAIEDDSEEEHPIYAKMDSDDDETYKEEEASDTDVDWEVDPSFYEEIQKDLIEEELYNEECENEESENEESENEESDFDKSGMDEITYNEFCSRHECTEDNCPQERKEEQKNYQENVPIHNEEEFCLREKEIKELRAIHCQKSITSIGPCYGISNIGQSCYLNVFLQLLLILPQDSSEENKMINKYVGALSDEPSYFLLYSFIEALYEELITSTQTILLHQFIDHFAGIHGIDPYEIINIINIEGGGSVATLIRDFMLSEFIEVVQNGKRTKIVQIDPNMTFQDNISTVQAETIHDVLICEREQYISSLKFEFPLSFLYNGVKMALKSVITHPTCHFKCYNRIGTTDTFVEINDSRVSTNKRYPLTYSNIALYIKIE